MNSWDHLPNARHIDKVLSSMVPGASRWRAAWTEVRTTSHYSFPVARKIVHELSRDRIFDDILTQVRWLSPKSTDGASRMAAKNALLALVAYDDCNHLISSPVDEVKLLANLGDARACLLLSLRLAIK